MPDSKNKEWFSCVYGDISYTPGAIRNEAKHRHNRDDTRLNPAFGGPQTTERQWLDEEYPNLPS